MHEIPLQGGKNRESEQRFHFCFETSPLSTLVSMCSVDKQREWVGFRNSSVEKQSVGVQG